MLAMRLIAIDFLDPDYFQAAPCDCQRAFLAGGYELAARQPRHLGGIARTFGHAGVDRHMEGVSAGAECPVNVILAFLNSVVTVS